MATRQQLPAILLGGPPHAGKSVLSYYLSRSLRARSIPHYLLRIAPDGEGDWYQEGDRTVVGELRQKGAWTEDWLAIHRHNIAARQLPLLLDTGGKPTSSQKAMFDDCTHMILLSKTESDRQIWLADANAHGLEILADLVSEQNGMTSVVERVEGRVEGRVCGLERGISLDDWKGRGNFEVLLDCISRIMPPDADPALRGLVLGNPIDATLVNLDHLARDLYPHDSESRFVDHDLPRILSRIPDAPLALYGRMPSWLACALGVSRDVRWVFNAASGWVKVPRLLIGAPGVDVNPINQQLRIAVEYSGHHETTLHLSPSQGIQWFDPLTIECEALPFLDPAHRVVIDGRIPLWLTIAISSVLRHQPGLSAPQAQHRPLP